MISVERKRKIMALHEMDLEPFLQGLGLHDAFVNGQLRCSACNVPITRNNIGFVYALHDDILVCCSSTECLFKVTELRVGAQE